MDVTLTPGQTVWFTWNQSKTVIQIQAQVLRISPKGLAGSIQPIIRFPEAVRVNITSPIPIRAETRRDVDTSELVIYCYRTKYNQLVHLTEDEAIEEAEQQVEHKIHSQESQALHTSVRMINNEWNNLQHLGLTDADRKQLETEIYLSIQHYVRWAELIAQ